MWLDRYMAIPFKDRGRDFAGCDCFGLYMLMLANEAGVALGEPDASHGVNAKVAAGKIEAATISGDWIEVARGNGAVVKRLAQKFDCVLMTAHVHVGMAVVASELHIGVALGKGKMIHTEYPAGCDWRSIDDETVVNRVRAIYRPKALTKVAA